jgi:hypothetical protein
MLLHQGFSPIRQRGTVGFPILILRPRRVQKRKQLRLQYRQQSKHSLGRGSSAACALREDPAASGHSFLTSTTRSGSRSSPVFRSSAPADLAQSVAAKVIRRSLKLTLPQMPLIQLPRSNHALLCSCATYHAIVCLSPSSNPTCALKPNIPLARLVSRLRRG